jgi:RNA methyltransferase, TrmH family
MYGLKTLSKLNQKKYRQEFNCFIVEGKRGVLDAVLSNSAVVQLIATDSFVKQQGEFCQQPKVSSFFDQQKVLVVSNSEFSQLTETVTPQGIAAVVEIKKSTIDDLEKGQLLVLLEDIRDPGNLGTMIRTADWFGVDGIILAGGADPYQPKVVRSSMGSLFHVPIFTSLNIVNEISSLKKAGFQLIVTRPEVEQTDSLSPLSEQKQCIVFGSEAHGTSAQVDALADRALTIGKFGQAESLNVAVSFGIVMNEVRK